MQQWAVSAFFACIKICNFHKILYAKIVCDKMTIVNTLKNRRTN